VTEQKLNAAQIGPGLQQMYGVGVSQRVWAGWLHQAGAPARPGNRLANSLSTQRLVGILSGEEPLLRWPDIHTAALLATMSLRP